MACRASAATGTSFVGLERRTSRAGRDTVDHGPGAHDDIANSVAGCLVIAGRGGVEPGWLKWMAYLTGEIELPTMTSPEMVRLRAPIGTSHVRTLSGRELAVPTAGPMAGVIEVEEDDARPLIGAGFTRVKDRALIEEPWQ